MDSQPFTAASPLAQIFLRVFSRTSASLISSRASVGGAPAPRRPTARTSVISSRASVGGAPAPRRPTARTSVISSRASVGGSLDASPELGATYDPKVAPLADSEVLG